jgi:hypothetical protein
MAIAVRPIGHEDTLSLVGLSVAFAFAFWQNHALLNIVNQPLKQTTTSAARHAGAARRRRALRHQAPRTAQADRRGLRSADPFPGPARPI